MGACQTSCRARHTGSQEWIPKSTAERDEGSLMMTRHRRGCKIHGRGGMDGAPPEIWGREASRMIGTSPQDTSPEQLEPRHHQSLVGVNLQYQPTA
jgi:hypothetical protein